MSNNALNHREHSHELASQITKLLPAGFDAEFASFGNDDGVKLSMYVPSNIADRVEEIADDAGFVVGCTYDVDESEKFYTFDFNAAE